MKLAPATALLLFALPALAQTKTVHHTPAKPAAATRPASAEGCSPDDTQPTLPAAVPRVTGCAKPLYALRYLDEVVGKGEEVTPRRWLTVNYTGYLLDGTKFDSSVGKDPITFPYGAHQVIPGWDTGFEGMHIGGKRRLFIPFELAYGETGRPPVIPAKAELVFDVELLGISDTPPQPKTPPAPPAGATPPPATAPATNGAKPTTPPPATNPAAPPAKPANDGAKPTPPAPATDPTKPTSTPPKQ